MGTWGLGQGTSFVPKVYHVSAIEEGLTDYVYVGRPSKWGNPFAIGKDGTREEVIEKFAAFTTLTDEDIEELRGKNLVCWCAPLPCHGDVLLRWANA